MVIMALDHVRDYFHYDAFIFDPTDLSQTYPALFITRFLTHFCAPVFVFLAGTSAFFVGKRKSKKALAGWLIKRGLWLIFTEFTVVKFAWNFNLNYSTTFVQVIWVLGVSMIILAGFIFLPKKLVISISVLGIFGHNLFDSLEFSNEFLSVLWTILHVKAPINFDGYIFLMPMGYYFGELYKKEIDSEFRIKRLWQLGIVITLLFLFLRISNFYGDPSQWSVMDSFTYTLMSFFNLTKYPPSLLYLLITTGPTFIFLALAEKWKGKFFDILITIGRVPMFFYVSHIFAIHISATIAAMLTGYNFSDMIIDFFVTLQPELQGYGFGLPIVYIVWLLILAMLYPISSWFNKIKTNNKDIWWLSYL